MTKIWRAGRGNLGDPVKGGGTATRIGRIVGGLFPTLTIPAPQVGQVATINNGLVSGGQASYQYQWWTDENGQIGGATSQTYTVTSGEAGLSLYGRWRQSIGGGKFSRWYPTNRLQISAPAANPYLTAGQYEIREARIGETINGTLITTPRRTAFIIYDQDPLGGKTWSFSRGTTLSAIGLATTQIAPMTLVSGRRYEAASGGQGAIGGPGYGRIAQADVSTEANGFWASDLKAPPDFVFSNIPYNFENANDLLNGSVSVVPGALPGSIDVTFTSPFDGGQPLTIDLWLDGALKVAGITDGTYTYTAPTDWAVEADPYTPVVDHTFEFRFTNANGSATPSVRTSKVKEDVVAAGAPVITNLVYNSGPNTITFDVDQPGEVALMFETSATARAGTYVRDNLTGAPAYLSWYVVSAGTNTIPGSALTGFGALATNTYYIKPAARNSTLVYSGTVASPPSIAVTAVSPPVISSFAYNSGTGVITFNVDQSGDYAIILESASTARDGSYINTNLATSPAYKGWTAHAGTVSVNINTFTGYSGLTPGTFYIKPGARNASGVYSASVTALSVTIAAPSSPTVVQETSAALSGFTTHVHTLPSGITSGHRLVALFASNGGSITTPSGWTRIGSLFGMGSNGNIGLYQQTALSAGTEGGTTVSFVVAGGSSNSVFFFWELALIDDVVNAFDATISVVDPPSHTPAGGSAERLWFAAAARTNGTSLFTTAPTGYGNLMVQQTGFNSNNHINAGAARKLATAASDDPSAFSGGAGTSRVALTFSAR